MSSYFIGTMQGRLLPKYKGRYQAHPVNYWQDEFEVAKSVGINGIEFILDFNDVDLNPLMNDVGVNAINQIVNDTGVAVKTICADYFMEAPLHVADIASAKRSFNVLKKLITNAVKLQVTDIVIPCVDQSSLTSFEDKERFVAAIQQFLPLLEKHKINLSLETDLPPKAFKSLLMAINSPFVTVNYDIGNSAALGFDPEEELACYGEKISDIHIKDRVLNSGPVELGKGDAQFERFFNALKKFNYSGPFIMQAYRDDEGLAIFKSQLAWVKPYLDAIYE
ncbi:sugar phosphate isomerase/epimerase family protein [Algibacillus agarilyticus]|uniref:sugar phosphate isomerase/epimerase family protein n=1 Tax=Algibacillus agarilyticus TaxID=2234133 RepID=UPI0018E52FFF|nr:TIM barrel protein [Algibacillus agarilyticus]